MRYWSASKSAAFVMLLLFVLLFAVLAVDIMVRVWHSRAGFDTPIDVVFILYMEAVRTLVTVAGVVVAVVAAVRARRRPAFGVLAFGVLFATLAYTKLIGFVNFAGAVQEHGALWLHAHGIPQRLLSILFAHPEWAYWPALAAFILFAARYPRTLSAADIERSGARDRAGALRSVALAGVDIGQLARASAAAMLRRGWLRGPVVWSAALVAAVGHTAASRTLRAPLAVNLVALLVAAVPIATLIALFRASGQASNDEERVPLLWLRRGAAAGLVLFAMSALATPLLPQLPLGGVALSLGPAALAACWLVAVLRAPQPVGARS